MNPPLARAWFARVSPSSPRSLAPRLPDAPPDTSIPVSPPRLEIDPGLKPPILRTPAQLELPESIRRSVGDRPATVELDLRIDEEGYVSKVRWDGVGDSALAEAARRCAEGMRFFPALKGDRPVAVWCRQRFEVGAALTPVATRLPACGRSRSPRCGRGAARSRSRRRPPGSRAARPCARASGRPSAGARGRGRCRARSS